MHNTRSLSSPTIGPSLELPDFRSAVAKTVVALDMQAVSPAVFHGAVAGHPSGDIQLLRIAADAHSVQRTESLIRTSPQHYYKFTLMESGSGLIVQDGRESALGSGDMTLYDTDRPYSLLCDDDVSLSIVMVPKTLLTLPSDVLRRITATRLDGTSGMGAIVRPYLASFARVIADLDAHASRRLARSAVELVTALLEDGLGPVTGADAHQTLVRRILDFIDEHLDSPELAPPLIASSHFISVRHLHTLFNDQGTTVSTVIRTRRLERCYDQLIDPACANRSVTSIALDNGFVDSAHFSRTFRAHYGVPPSTLRPHRD